MIYAVKNMRIFMVAVLCLNFVITKAGDRRMPVPKLRTSRKDSTASLVAFSPLVFIGFLQDKINHIQFPRLIYNMDCSYLKKIAQDLTEMAKENRVMLSVAASAALLALLIKQVQQSETCGPWCNKQYDKISTVVDTYIDACIKEYPLPAQAVAAPIKIMMQFFCNVIKKYIAMNRTTIIYATASPVLGRALDCGGIFCPVPFLNWAAVGGGVSAYVCIKGYFDQSLEEVNKKLENVEKKIDDLDTKNMQEHIATQNQLGQLTTKVESNITWVKASIKTVNTKINNILLQIGQLKRGVSNINMQLGSAVQGITHVSGEMKELKEQIALLQNKNSEQYEDLKRNFKTLQEQYNKAMLLLNEKSKSDEKWQQELRKDLGTTATHLSNQMSGVEKKVEEVLASQKKAILPPEISSANDLRKQLLMIELGHS